MKSFAKIVSWILIVALLCGAVALIFVFTDGGKEDFKTFYIEQDGKKILSSHTEAVFVAGETVEYTVNYTFDVGAAEKRDYIVKIVPNADEDFTFSVKDTAMHWRDMEALDGTVFDLRKDEASFRIDFDVDGDYLMEDVMAKLFPGKSVELPEGMDLSKPYFTLYVASYDESVQFFINFSLTAPSVPVGQPVQVNWSPGPMSLTRTKQFLSGDTIGDYRPEGYEGVVVWYTDIDRTRPYDFSKPLTHDVNLFCWSYTISCRVEYVHGAPSEGVEAANLVCPPRAFESATVVFSYDLTSYSGISAIVIERLSSGSELSLCETEIPLSGTLSFVMPAENVCIKFVGVY